MQPGERFPLGVLTRLAGAGFAAFTASQLGVEHAIAAAVATAASSYFVNRATSREETFEGSAPVSSSRQLRLVLAGAFRIALENLRAKHAKYGAFFESWLSLLDAALENPDTVLDAVIPGDYAGLIGASNPHLDDAAGGAAVNAFYEFWFAGPNDLNDPLNAFAQCVGGI